MGWERTEVGQHGKNIPNSTKSPLTWENLQQIHLKLAEVGFAMFFIVYTRICCDLLCFCHVDGFSVRFAVCFAMLTGLWCAWLGG